ncbi:lysine N(6)-hydroxylase/L-ornithine N(5)-oxygenase family protein [Streptomyces cyaneus]|uniref:lysine N(6)-hydroxylase/L-ornithine N(5)-oxygenase family protein n=1 Tax=Streptomyces cyaneus TaxID=1904 RepID=UPI000FF88324|nr:SidA/IucD/PvdA family monooxygenase [Streptomyces cyaneus]
MTRGDDLITHRLIGIGVGPANLSLAALLDTSENSSDDVFFEAKESFQWHAGMMLPDAEMQVHFLKDLVTPVDPTNPHSVLAYAVSRGELYTLLNTRRQRVSRREFEAYCSWVARRLPSVRFGSEVLDVRWDGAFEVTTTDGAYRAQHLSIGTGVVPKVPACAQGRGLPGVIHSADFLHHSIPADATTVVVVGGGQSGAEVVAHLQETLAPDVAVEWVTRRNNFLPLDESPFVEDIFTPEASEEFFHRPAGVRMRLLADQQLASDGVSDYLLERIYRRMYDVRNGYREGPRVRTSAATELIGLETAGPRGTDLTVRDRLTDEQRTVRADFVVLATGYEQALPEAVRPLLPLISLDDGRPNLRPDFSVEWDGSASSRIFVQNGARHARGVADPNLSLLAWRSATIAVAVAADLGKRLLEPHLPPDRRAGASPHSSGSEDTQDWAREPRRSAE